MDERVERQLNQLEKATKKMLMETQKLIKLVSEDEALVFDFASFAEHLLYQVHEIRDKFTQIGLEPKE